MSEIIPNDYAKLLKDIKELVRTTQLESLKFVNKKLISMYWEIGKMITERQTGETWGKSVVEKLSKDLREEFPEITGFSSTSLWYMRNFYLAYYQNEKLPLLVGEIGFSIIVGNSSFILGAFSSSSSPFCSCSARTVSAASAMRSSRFSLGASSG